MKSDSRVVETWHEILKGGDFEGLDRLLDEDVVFESPVVHTPQRGAAITKLYLSAAHQVLVNPSWRYIEEWIAERSAVLEFQTELDGIQINGIDLMRWNDEGRLVHFKVFVRPLKAIQRIHGLMRQLLEANGG